jgi:hypothetical protein
MSVQVITRPPRRLHARRPDTEKGWFSMHPQYSPFQRFTSKIRFDPTGCWIWTAGRSGGYPRFWACGERMRGHWFSYLSFRGPIPKGMIIHHLCYIPVCVNPNHLEVVSRRANTLYGCGPTAENARKTHCIRGHPFDLFNTYTDEGGRRACRTCGNENGRRYRQRLKAKRRPA